MSHICTIFLSNYSSIDISLQTYIHTHMCKCEQMYVYISDTYTSLHRSMCSKLNTPRGSVYGRSCCPSLSSSQTSQSWSSPSWPFTPGTLSRSGVPPRAGSMVQTQIYASSRVLVGCFIVRGGAYQVGAQIRGWGARRTNANSAYALHQASPPPAALLHPQSHSFLPFFLYISAILPSSTPPPSLSAMQLW